MKLTRSRAVAAALLIFVLLAGSATAFAECLTVLNECSGDPAGTCTITGTHTMDASCNLPFGNVDVTITASGSLDVQDGNTYITAKSFTIAGGGRIIGTDGYVDITTTYAVDIQRSGAGDGKIDITTTDDASTPGILIDASALTVAGILRAVGGTDTYAPGGEIEIDTTGNVTFQSGSTLSVHGASGNCSENGDGAASGGDIDIEAGGNVDIFPNVNVEAGAPVTDNALAIDAGGTVTLHAGVSGQATCGDGNEGAGVDIDAVGAISISGELVLNGNGGGGNHCNSGGNGGSVELDSAGGSVTVEAITANGNGGNDGGAVDIEAGTGVTLGGVISLNGGTCSDDFGGWGGTLIVSAGEGITASASVSADGVGFGRGGDVDFTAGGAVQTSAIVSANGGNMSGTIVAGLGGDIAVTADSLTVDAAIQASGSNLSTFAGGGTINFLTIHDININANVRANGVDETDDGGTITMTAGSGNGGLAGAKLRVSTNKIQADGGGCVSGGACSKGGVVNLTACDVQIDGPATIEAKGQGAADSSYGVNRITGRRNVTINGSVDARKQTNGTADGHNVVKWRDSKTIGATALKPSGSNSTVTQDTSLTPCHCGAGSTNGSSCNDSNGCTQTDTCQNQVCTGSNPVTCPTPDQCHNPGTCQPATGTCDNPAKPNGTTCNDTNACTQTDTCQSGTCSGSNPVVCTALDQCHNAGTCNTSTGICSNPNKANGTSCNDANACTQTDTCQTGTCTGSNPVVCTALDQCHNAGTCNTSTGICSNPNKANGTSCNDANACTQTDTCQTGTCTGGNPVVCTALDQCHDAGTCNTSTGNCSNPNKSNGTSCNDANACTQTDTCQTGTCTGGNPVVCTALDQCHDVGTCNTGTGVCSNPNKSNGTSCDDADACTQTDTCQSGVCDGDDPVECTALDQCHDVGTCNTGTGVCSNPNKTNGTSCDDADECTDGDECVAGECTPGDFICPVAPLVLVRTFEAPASGDFFGGSLAALDSDSLVVGAVFEYQFASTPAGAVYIYNVTTGALEQTFENPAPEEYGEFGISVANVDGNVLIGAPQSDVDSVTNAGLAYLYDPGSTTPLATYEPDTLIENGGFGYSVGAIGDDALVVQPKALQAFRIDGATGTVETTYAQDTPYSYKWGNFITPVGDHVVVGDMEGGRVFVFDMATGAEEYRIQNPNGDYYGFSGVADGTDLVLGGASGGAGNGTIDRYESDTGDLIHSMVNPDAAAEWWGMTVAVVGPRLITMGSDTLYVIDPATDDVTQTIPNPQMGVSGVFGWAITGMGNSVIVGAPYGEGHVFVFAPCGDGNVDPGETCDDGDTDSGDGCSDTCQTE